MTSMHLRIKRLRPDVELPRYATPGSAAFDLAAADRVDVAPGAVVLVGTGLVVHVPAGFFLAIFARSSTPLRRKLMVANGVGVLDSDYCGPEDEVKVQVWNMSAETVTLAPGDRIAQGMVLPAPQITWEEVKVLEHTSRGGFGSTGQGNVRSRE